MATGKQNASVGRYGERIAERYLAERGMEVLDRNWRCRAGEIDLVLHEGDVLVICEVKTRHDDGPEHPVAAVTDAKAERLQLLALLWQEAHDVRVEEVRVDVVGVLLPRRGAAVVDHVRGIC